MRIRNKHKELKLEYFLDKEKISSSSGEIFRWIEYVGWADGWTMETGEPRYRVRTPMGGYFYLKCPLVYFQSKEEMMFEKDRLNSEIVKEFEPENFNIHWSDIYNKTHK
jgi:hypothetical protein